MSCLIFRRSYQYKFTTSLLHTCEIIAIGSIRSSHACLSPSNLSCWQCPLCSSTPSRPAPPRPWAFRPSPSPLASWGGDWWWAVGIVYYDKGIITTVISKEEWGLLWKFTTNWKLDMEKYFYFQPALRSLYIISWYSNHLLETGLLMSNEILYSLATDNYHEMWCLSSFIYG